jgi:hypothetical protein
LHAQADVRIVFSLISRMPSSSRGANLANLLPTGSNFPTFGLYSTELSLGEALEVCLDLRTSTRNSSLATDLCVVGCTLHASLVTFPAFLLTWPAGRLFDVATSEYATAKT